jgi:chromosome segregation ATPase
MQGKVARTESETAACAPSIEEVRAQLGAIEDQKARLLDDVAKLRHSKEISQASLHSLTQQIAAIKQAKATLNTDHGVNVPRVK